MSNEDIVACDAYLKNRLEFIKRHSVYGANINEAELKTREKEIALMYKKQDKYIEENTNNEEN